MGGGEEPAPAGLARVYATFTAQSRSVYGSALRFGSIMVARFTLPLLETESGAL